MQLRVLAFVLAGGKGTRLYPLTKERAKPAVPFGGRYRIVDFVLSNFINSGIHSIYVLIQFKSQSLLQHLRDGWEFAGLLKNNFIIPVPAQMRSSGEQWYRGTADAIFQNINLIEQANPDLVCIFGADHI
jgi:glucose-1-phosphate adenylyltransferase